MRYALLPDSPAGPSKTTHLSRQLFSLSAFLILVMSTEAETSLTIACSVFRSVPLDSDGLTAVAFLIETRLLPTFARSYPRRLRQSGSDPSMSLIPFAPFFLLRR